jgi:protein-tyrosine phosphatase
VDDGAEDMMMARMMLLRALEQNIYAVFCTPHSEAFRYSKDGARIIFDRLKHNVESVYPDVKLYLGCEVYCEARIMDQVLEDLNTGRYPTMNNSKYVLMEFYGGVEQDNAMSCVEAMVNGGYTPIIAHVERYGVFRRDKTLADEVLSMGALLQLNADSVLGKRGFALKRCCHRLLKQGKAHFIASDAHDRHRRPPALRECFEYVRKHYGEDYAWVLMRDNARALLSGQWK